MKSKKFLTILSFGALACGSIAAQGCNVQVAGEGQFAADDADAVAEDAQADADKPDASQPDTAAAETSTCGKCDDGNPCTEDSCGADSQCVHTKKTASSCEDGNPCTIDDTCQDGDCKPGKPKTCVSDDPCLVSKCDATQGGQCKLTSAVDETACDDKSACTESDKCSAGSCKGTPLVCNDGKPCTDDTCDPKTGCVAKPLTGKSCDDDNPCTLGDACDAGECKSGGAKECKSPDPCFSSKCSLADGKCKLTEIAEGGACNDNSACTEKDACKGGVCSGNVILCDDKNPCTIDSCDAKDGCKTTGASGPCDDANPCTSQDACANSACAGVPIDVTATCGDNNPCTQDGCDLAKGCTHTAASGACDDGNPCTKNDACDNAGKCAAGANTCSCQVDADCAKEEDGDLCNGTLFCDKSGAAPKCNVKPETIVVCNTAANTVCSTQQCDPKKGKCAAVAAADGKSCDADGNVCTQLDQCAAGACKPGALLSCNDNNPCTADSCDPAKGCVYAANTADCDADKDACTVGDKCQDKVCLAGGKKVCEDNESCTDDSCDAATGNCKFVGTAQEGKPCDADKSVCTENDACAAGKCAAGKFKNCDDGNKCTNDSCDAKNGCSNLANTNPCDDGNACTAGDQCAQGKCGGTAQNPAVMCGDQNPCTDETCDPAKGCVLVNNTASCDDGSVCTVGDACAGGKCVSGASQCSCQQDSDCQDDGNLCNGTPTCDKTKVPYACKVNPATVITCSSAGDTTCSQNQCDTKSGKCGMVPINNAKSCDDGSLCTSGDFCSGGNCTPGPTVKCDDNNVCTDDSCDPKAGCKSTKNTAPCTDGNACTEPDLCTNGTCYGPQKVCNDNNPCTDDLCDKAAGCKAPANTAACNDNNACTLSDMCDAGKCVGSGAPKCDDANPCTVDACDPTKGCTNLGGNNGSACNDNNPCTSGDTCQNGNCAGPTAVTCDDKNPCTKDQCVAAKGGCVADPLAGANCDDGNKCTGSAAGPDACDALGTCKGGANVVCNDNNPCTDDACNPSVGCGYANNTKPCDDGQLCTINDACSGGACKGTAGAPDNDGDGYGSAQCPGGADCDDTNKLVNPKAKEDCGTTFDDNCNGPTNEQDANGCSKYLYDGDGDGYPLQDANGNYPSQCWCGVPGGGSKYVLTPGKAADCNDFDNSISPAAQENCSTQADDNCDGSFNNLGALNCQKFFVDKDKDGYYAAGAASQCSCFGVAEYTAQKDGDCDDANDAASPALKEDCKTAFDDNCNGNPNDADAANCSLFYFDNDQDGYYGSGASAQKQCLCAPSGKFSAAANFSGDCDDNNHGLAPNVPEVCDGWDQNCSGTADEGCDDDQDGYCDADMQITADAKCQGSKKPGSGAYTLGRALILVADTQTSADTLRKNLNGNFFAEGVDMRYVMGPVSNYPTPSLADLRRYSTVVVACNVVNNVGFGDAAALGNVLNDYVFEGGSVILYGAPSGTACSMAGGLANFAPFANGWTEKTAQAFLDSAAGYSPQQHPLSMDNSAGQNFFFTGGTNLGTITYLSGGTLGPNFTVYSNMSPSSIGGTPHTPLVVHRPLGYGRLIGLNIKAGVYNQTLDQLARDALHYASRGWGDDCDDASVANKPGGTADTGCNGVDEDCNGFDNCGSVCSAFDNIDNANGWEFLQTDVGPDAGVPSSGSAQAVECCATPWKATFWGNSQQTGSSGLGIVYGPMDTPAISTAPGSYPDTGTKWTVARKTFASSGAFLRFEFRYRYLPDAFESAANFDNFAVRLDAASNAPLTVTPAKKASGNWHTVSFKNGVGYTAGNHTIYLFFKTGDANYNNGAGAVFDQFRTCMQ